MKFTTANGIVLHYALEGPEDAPLLVFSNSLGTDFRVWAPLLPQLGGPFRSLRYDKRGHGLSECPDSPYAIEDHVEDLVALLDHLGITSAVVVGLSVGGIIAQGLSTRRPELVKGLVLCDTAEKIGPPEMWDQRMEAIRAGGIEALAEAILQRWFSEGFRSGRQAELAGWRAMLVRTPAEGYLGTAAAIRNADMTAQARAIAVPTLCVCGSEDGATTPEMVRSLAALIPGARYEEIAGAGHLPCVEAPETLASLMRDFLGEHGLA